jgi:uncharacterized lipoprotein
MAVSEFGVTGPVCGACLAELLEQVRTVGGVTNAAADLGSAGTALLVLRGPADVSTPELGAAVTRAGFALTPARRARRRGRYRESLLAAGAVRDRDRNDVGGVR